MLRKRTSALFVLLLTIGYTSPILAADPPVDLEERRLALEFRDATWSQVLEWLSDEIQLPVIPRKPVGTFTFIPPRSGKEAKRYTVWEVIDILNTALSRQDYMLVRGERFIQLADKRQKIEHGIPEIRLSKLQFRGQSEWVRVNIPLQRLQAGELAAQIKELLTSQTAEVLADSRSNSLLVTDSTGSIRRVLSLIESMDRPPSPELLEKQTSFQMFEVPWRRVLDWFGEQSGQLLLSTEIPKGTFSYLPGKQGGNASKHTLPEIIDLLNDSLVENGFLLVQEKHAIRLIRADELIDPNLVPRVDIGELGRRRRSELVAVLVPLEVVGTSVAVPQVRKVLGPFGGALLFEQDKHVFLQDTAGNLRRLLKLTTDLTEPRGSRTHVLPETNAALPSPKPQFEPENALAQVFLVEVTRSPVRAEAFLHDRHKDKLIRLRTSAGFDTFTIPGENGDVPLLNGKVIAIADGKIVYEAGDQKYHLEIGQNLKQARPDQ